MAGVFDGLGGLEYGESASLNAAKLCRLLLDKSKYKTLTEKDVESFYETSNSLLINYKRERNIDFGTTANICLICEKRVILSNLGDSRTYIYRNGEITQCSADHNDCHIASINSDMSGGLSQYLGCDCNEFKMSPYIHTVENDFKTGDCIVMLSDGAYSYISDDDIVKILSKKSKNCAEKIVLKSMEKGSLDNSTAVVIKF